MQALLVSYPLRSLGKQHGVCSSVVFVPSNSLMEGIEIAGISLGYKM